VKAVVFLEHRGGELARGALGVLSKAATLGEPVAAAIVGGPDVKALVPQAGRYGASSVYVVESGDVADPLPQPRVDALAAIVAAGGFDTVLLANSVLAGDVAAGLAVRLDGGVNWDLVDLSVRDGQLVGVRPALGDSIVVEVGWRSGPQIALFRAGSFEPVPVEGPEPEVHEVAVATEPHSVLARLVEQRLQQQSAGPSIEDADVVVAGGMGLGAAENFSLAEALADALGGVVGATRAAVYAGWYPYSAQVGQTGKTVAPKLYVALGISGAVQHKVGMQNAKTIVAVNSDPNAPIFEFSDLAVVGDVHAVVPELIELVRQRRQGAS
jgi:electron transfer flavoprotein alpha subunit